METLTIINPAKITKTDKISFNEKINKHVYKTSLVGTGSFWYFDNGQYGEKTENKEGYQFHLSYNYDRVYFNHCRYNGSGWRSGGTQYPLTNVQKIGWYDIAKQLFDADKRAGVINENYKFQ